MKTKSSSRSSKKKTARSTTASVRGRTAKVTSARTKKAATSAKAKKPSTTRSKTAAPVVERAKYRQSGAPWWKAFL